MPISSSDLFTEFGFGSAFFKNRSFGFRTAQIITDSAARHQPCRATRVVLDLFAQTSDGHVNRAHVAEIIISPNGLKQVLTRHDLADMLGQIVQKLEFAVRQLDFFAVL